jgi:Ser/Thr protein kinase RdoA (MazF antagonist)
MPDRQKHQQEVQSFLQKHFPNQSWIFSIPSGTGMETYFVQGSAQSYFVKVGVAVERYQAMAEIGLTPPVLASGHLESGLSVIVQPLVRGHNPSRRDYQDQLKRVAGLLRIMHNDPRVRDTLHPAPSNHHKDAGLHALSSLRQRWKHHRAQVSSVAEFVDRSLDMLESQIQQFSSTGLASSHNDICNANWLFTPEGRIYIVDFESMSLDDPAVDLGALLWWYYPPQCRSQFLEIAGYPSDPEFNFRMRVRMALHGLSITLPREGSFDRFNPECFGDTVVDFRAILAGKENPQGYDV